MADDLAVRRLNKHDLAKRLIAGRKRAQKVHDTFMLGLLIEFTDDELRVLEGAGYLSLADCQQLRHKAGRVW